MSNRDISPYTPAARYAVESAPAHAAALGHDVADTGHLLLGLVADDRRGMAGVLLHELRVQPAVIQRAVERRMGLGPRPAGNVVPLSEAAGRALNLALEENPVAGPYRIGTDHLLLGLLAEGGVAGEVLAAHGVTAEGVRTAREQVRDRMCYGCAERAGGEAAVGGSPVVVPAEFAVVMARVAALQRAKEEAVDAQDFVRAAAIRDEEKGVLRRAVGELGEEVAKERLVVAIDTIMKLRTEADRLRGLLHHRHGGGV